jgi:MinD-like ATPase involved in chromosome partitioning or flagellar assembly
VIIVDGSPNLNNEILATMAAADELYVVTGADYASLSATMHAVKLAKKRGTPITGLILNRLRNKNFELSVAQIEQSAEVPVIGTVPDHNKVLEAAARTCPLVEHASMSSPAIEFNKIAAFLAGAEYEDPRWFAQLIRGFKRATKIEMNQLLTPRKPVQENKAVHKTTRKNAKAKAKKSS